MKTILYMVRHAESPFEFGKERSRGLSAEGMAEARRVTEVFTGIDIQYMASSPYTRAKQTIQYIAEQKGLTITEYEALRERSMEGPDDKTGWDQLYEAIRKSFDDKDFALEGGESARSVQQRALPVIQSLLDEQRGSTIVIGTHGNIMTIIMNYYDDRYGFEFWDKTTKPDIYKLTFDWNHLEQVERIWK
ncbi:histidine phosphatase family protein [Paenibacillus nasutitermitis]|uniref:Phosphoglycerate mutase n=1 Tax=Paenibacillus nasutitermitis TaxID=1652958 RepID=A0A916YP05_9BACL|nr:histidine phosphatase family protein [Paenibacillus nasutitermitis]GGD53921.1 phosphoglycerate mutase [Paenibacillus nasutitermitis]